MARPREFDEEEVLNKAMMCFWRKGYSSASISDLEKEVGISRISLYNAYKDKRGLFMAIQNRYLNSTESFMKQVLSDPDLDSVITFLNSIPNEDDGSGVKDLGCMMVNTALDVHSVSEAVIENVKRYRDMIEDIYSDYFKRCQQKGSMRKDMDSEVCAEFIVANLWGSMATSRLYHDVGQTRPQIELLVKTVEGWKA